MKDSLVPGDTYLSFDTGESDSEESDHVPSPTEQVQPRPVENDATAAKQGPTRKPDSKGSPRTSHVGLESLSFSDAMAQRAILTEEEGLSKDASTKLRDTHSRRSAHARAELLTRLQKMRKVSRPSA